MKSTTANKEIQPMKDEIKEIIADFDDLYVWVNKDGEYVIAEANTLRNWKREEFIDWLEKTLSQLQLSSMQRMADENKDTQRLDFLDNCNKALNKHSGTDYGWELILNHNVNRLMSGSLDRIDLHDSKAGVDKLDSCRDAIDKAIDRLKAQQLMENK